jgi:hypothetical protein
VIGFVITLLVLGSVAVGLFLARPTVQVRSLPASVPEYSAVWARYVPSSALLFGYENYTAIRRFTTYPVFGTLLDLPDLGVELTGQGMVGVLTIVLSTPNASVDMAFVNDAAFRNFTTALAPHNASAVIEGGNRMYYVRNYFGGQFQFGWLAIIPSDKAVAFSLGSNDAEAALIEVFGVQAGTVKSVITRPDVRRMLYIVNGTGIHLSIGLQDFAGVVRTSNATLTAVDSSSTLVQVARVVEFNSSQAAVNDWTDVRSAFLNAHGFTVYDSFVEAVELGQVSNIVQYVRLVE